MGLKNQHTHTKKKKTMGPTARRLHSTGPPPRPERFPQRRAEPELKGFNMGLEPQRKGLVEPMKHGDLIGFHGI
jgi:hypothetical protein